MPAAGGVGKLETFPGGFAGQVVALSLARMQSAVRLGIDSSPEEADLIFQRHAADGHLEFSVHDDGPGSLRSAFP
jgi:hypothetical protein